MAATTWNPADKSADITLSNGNLTATTGSSGFDCVRSVFGASAGKFYFEVTFVAITTGLEPVSSIGLADATVSLDAQPFASAVAWMLQDENAGNGVAIKYHNSVLANLDLACVQDNIVMIAVDFDAGKIWWGVNGTWADGGNPSAGTGEQYSGLSGTLYAFSCMRGGTPNIQQTANFGASAFSYTVPTGFTQGFGTGLPGGSRKKSSPIWL